MRSPWAWVPSLYFAEGLPYVVAMTVSVILYKRLGVDNAEIALATSWLYLPWVVKPLWSPIVDVLRTRRQWVIGTQIAIGASMVAVAVAIPSKMFFPLTIGCFALMAIASATHDIAADGFYMLGLGEGQQASFIGLRTTFYRLAMIAGQGGLVYFAGHLEKRMSVPGAWSIAFGLLAATFFALTVWHSLAMPRPALDVEAHSSSPRDVLLRFFDVFAEFFKKPGIVRIVAFLLVYRFAEAQLVKLISPFLLDARAKGGLGLATDQVGVAYGTVGLVSVTLGGLLGGVAISRGGLKQWLWPMVCAIHLPDLAFVFLSQVQPQNLFVINAAIALEQFGYGFGFTAYSLFMIMISSGPYKTAHFAICTGFMALGMMLPGMFSGYLQEWLGYRGFFVWVILSTVPGFLVAALVRIDPAFGRKAT